MSADRPVTIAAALSVAVAELEASGVAGARLDAQLLLAHAYGRDRAWLLAHDNEQIDPKNLEVFRAFIKQRAEHVPVVHLTGQREFYGLTMVITPDVLTPRVETEQMVEWAVSHTCTGGSLIDIGTGSGAIAVAIKHHRPDLDVTATDVSERELTVARQNAKAHQANIEFIVSDLWGNVQGQFDSVVTNLPYLRDDADLMPEVTREPSVALFGGADGLDLYRRFLAGLPEHLMPGGLLFTECDPWQHADLTEEAARYGLELVWQDYFILGFKRRS